MSQTTSTTTGTIYFVVSAPGHYGDTTRVKSSHRSLEAAKKAARRGSGLCVRVGDKEKGATFYRSSEETYPMAD